MTAQEILKKENIYFKDEVIAGVPCTIGYMKKFKWGWMATQLNTFVIIGKTDAAIDKNLIESFSTSCYEYSLKNNMGWPRGLQAAVGSVAILQGSNINAAAIGFCEKLTKKHFSAFEIPVIYNLTEKRAHRFISAPIWGKIYFPYFAKNIDIITSQLGNS